MLWLVIDKRKPITGPDLAIEPQENMENLFLLFFGVLGINFV